MIPTAERGNDEREKNLEQGEDKHDIPARCLPSGLMMSSESSLNSHGIRHLTGSVRRRFGSSEL